MSDRQISKGSQYVCASFGKPKESMWALIGWGSLKALFAKAISSERSAKLGFDVLFNAGRRKNNFSSFTQSYKAANHSSLAPLIRAVVQPLCLMLAMVISPILASAVVDNTNPVVTPPANLTVAASSLSGGTATVAPALASTFAAHDAALWQQSDGWSNGGMFQVGWRADHVSFANGNLILKLDNQPTCTTTSLACSNQPYASGEYKSLNTISHGRLTFRAKPAKGSGVVTGLFTYTGTSGTSSHDEIDIEFLGKNTTGVQFNYFVAGVGGHEFWLPLGFDAALAFHDYTIEWLPNAINWYVDGVLKHTVNAAVGVALPSRPQNIFMNLWASTGVNGWTGAFAYTAPIRAEVSQISYKPKATAAFASFLNGATATDNVGVVGDITNNVPVTLPVGTTTVTFTATDAAGNQGSATSTVTVSAYIPPDTTKPVIAVNGANPATVEAGQVYTDGLATVTDNVDPTNALLVGVSSVNTAAVGSYTVTYNASDVAGNAAIAVIRTVNVVDTTNPVLTLPANAVVNATGVRTAVAIGTAMATDLFAVTVSNNAPANFAVGTTPVTWIATDANGRVSTGIQQVTVNAVSTISAVRLNNGSTVTLAAPVGETVFQVAGAAAPTAMPAGVNFPFGTLAYSVTSPFAGSVTMSLAFSTPLPPVFHLYKIDNAGVVTAMQSSTWTKSGAKTIQLTLTDGGAFDLDGLQNSVIVDPVAIGVDTQAPVITVNGANPVTVEAGQSYVDALATVTDNVDPTNAVLAGVSTVNTAAVGSYIVTYNATDAAGNVAMQVIRTVHVVDTTNPVLTLPANVVANATGVRTVVAIGIATATDLFAVGITNNAPTNYPIGITQVIWTATDANGRASTGIQQVTVNTNADMIKPVISMNGGNVTVIQGQIYTDAGATASDNVDGNITASIVVNNVVNASVIGAYAVIYNVSDAAGNHAIQLTRTVNVVADQPPLITLIGATPITIVQGAVYNDGGATAIDDVDGDVTANIVTLNQVDTTVVASYTVTYDVKDAAGNAAKQMVRIVNVIPVGGAANPGEAVQIPLTGRAASAEVYSAGQSISNFSAVGSAGTPPVGVSVPLGVLSYTSTVPAGGISQAVNLSFSSALPASFVLYKVDNAGVYSIIPNGTGVDQWTQIDATTIVLTLTDGGQFDLDGITNGVIIDPVAVGIPPASVTAASAPMAVAAGGGCSINRSATFDPAMLALLLLALVGLARSRKV